jgi:hypothetical protein
MDTSERGPTWGPFVILSTSRAHNFRHTAAAYRAADWRGYAYSSIGGQVHTRFLSP